MIKTTISISLSLALLIFTAGCLPDIEEPVGTDSPTQFETEKAAQIAASVARIKGENLAAAQEQFFRPTPNEAAFLDAFVAHNLSGTPNGYFTNQDGVSGYFLGYDRPFNFTWDGATVEITAFDGRAYQVIDGPGKLTLKYADDSLLLQRYEGDYSLGLWEGHGRYWSRNREAGGHNYFSYQGGFKHDQMEGRGVVNNYNHSGRGSHPMQYAGQMRDSLFHGQGLATDLATGRVIYKGLWFEGQPFEGGLDEFRTREAYNELHSLDRQYTDLLVTGKVKILGAINPKPGLGALTVIPPLYTAKNVQVKDQQGRTYPLGKIEPLSAENSDSPEIFGVQADIPQSDYPLFLTISYEDHKEQKQYIRLTVKRPFVLQWEEEEENNQIDQGDDEAQLSTEEELREEIKAQLGLGEEYVAGQTEQISSALHEGEKSN